ncbi:putative EamA domain-containing protein [Dioscorea sansibarensis]
MDGVKLYAVVIIIQLTDAGMFMITKAALTFGLNPLVFVFYRHAFGTVLLLPLAMTLVRRTARPPISFMLLFKTFLLALIGMETLKLKSRSGMAKLLGILFCVTGIMIIALYEGPQLSSLNPHHIQFANHEGNSNHESKHSITAWIKGSFLVVFSCIIFSLWFISQGTFLKEYQSKLLFTTFVCIFSTIQSFIIAIMFQRDFDKWKLHWDVGLLAIVYTAVVVTGFSYYLQAWCVEKKGPVFLAITSPLSFVFTMIGSSFILGEKINLGSALGGISMVAGLYSVLWGQSKENKVSEPSIEFREL